MRGDHADPFVVKIGDTLGQSPLAPIGGTIRIMQLKDGIETGIDKRPVSVKNNLYFKLPVTNGKDIIYL